MDYSYVLGRAWQTVRQHKRLWLFGLCASLGSQAQLFLIQWSEDVPLYAPEQTTALYTGSRAVPAVVGSIVLALLIGLLAVMLGALGRAALVEQVNRTENGGAPTVRAGWAAARRCFWRVLLVRLLIGLPFLVLLAVGLIPFLLSRALLALAYEIAPVLAALAATLGTLVACAVPAACLGLFLAVPTYVLQRLAVRACVLQDLPVRASVARAWRLLREHLWSVALLWLILGVVTAMIACVLFFSWYLMTVGAAAVFIAVMALSTPSVALAVTVGLTLLVWLVGWGISGVEETFFSACWTVAYRELTGLGRTGDEPWPALGGSLDLMPDCI
jgi:hypothetical protein